VATVYITDELKRRTSNMISKMCLQEINNDVPGYSDTKQVEATQLYHMGCWGKDHVHLLNVIPKDWLRVDKSCHITVRGEDENGVEVGFSQSFDASSPVFYIRPSIDYWNRSDCKLSLNDVRAMPEDTPGRAEILQRWENEMIVRSINERWSKVTKDVTEFLDKCKSLNEAVKLFPTVRMYIHPQDLERLDRKVERPSQRRKLVEEIDADGLTAAAIAAKLMAAA
jgi:hypothetical protein